MQGVYIVTRKDAINTLSAVLLEGATNKELEDMINDYYQPPNKIFIEDKKCKEK
jgi:hypothetical protein